MALGFDLIARHFVLASQPDDVRQFMTETVTRIAWCIVPGPFVGGLLGFLLYPRLFRSNVARLRKDESAKPDGIEERADFKALMIATSLAQAPALLGDISVMLGARLTPALCSTGISVTAVMLIGTLAGRAAYPVRRR